MLIMRTGVNDRVCGLVCANMLYLRTEERIRRPLRRRYILPADSLVLATGGKAAHLLQVNQVDHDVLCPQVALQWILIYAARANYHDLGFLEHLHQIAGQKRADMRNDFFYVLTIGTDQASYGDIIVPDLDLAAFS